LKERGPQKQKKTKKKTGGSSKTGKRLDKRFE
jgi:hypothetical protein